MARRILFLYLTERSGHHAAAVAVEQAVRRLDGDVETLMLDSFSHGNPVLSKVTLKAYLAMLRAAPEIWEFMYDNPEFKRRTRKIREVLNRGNSKKLQKLLTGFRPDAVVCTQAFSCGVLASWKQATGRRQPALVGVLTDFVAHRYWANEQVDLYVAPNEETRQTLIGQGVLPERIKAFGIPISNRFSQTVDSAGVLRSLGLRPDVPRILVMGGSLGLGPMKSVIRRLDRLPQPFDIVAIAGQNRELHERLSRRGHKLRHRIKILGFAPNMHELMEVADMAITKPGGMTTAEALTKGLPLIVINPIPGQEQKNTEFLLAHGVAVEAQHSKDVAEYVDQFLRDPRKLYQMRAAAQSLGRPDAAENAACEILRLISNPLR